MVQTYQGADFVAFKANKTLEMEMNKIKLWLIILMVLLASTSAIAANRAVQIDIGGIGPPVDVAAMNTIKQVIGFAVAKGELDRYIVNNDGIHLPIEGGFSACAQVSPSTTKDEFVAFVKQLKAIKADPNTSFYSVRTISRCPQPVVFCPQDAKICPNGTLVGRVAPACAFTPCPSLVK